MIKYIAFFPNLMDGTFPDFYNFFNSNLDTNKKILIIGPRIKNEHIKIINDGGVEYIIFLKINIYLFLNFIKIPIVLFIKIPYVLIF
jgi:hypothetical protein